MKRPLLYILMTTALLLSAQPYAIAQSKTLSECYNALSEKLPDPGMIDQCRDITEETEVYGISGQLIPYALEYVRVKTHYLDIIRAALTVDGRKARLDAVRKLYREMSSPLFTAAEPSQKQRAQMQAHSEAAVLLSPSLLKQWTDAYFSSTDGPKYNSHLFTDWSAVYSTITM